MQETVLIVVPQKRQIALSHIPGDRLEAYNPEPTIQVTLGFAKCTVTWDNTVALAEADGNRTRRGSCDLPPVLKTGEPTRRSLASDLKGTGERLLP